MIVDRTFRRAIGLVVLLFAVFIVAQIAAAQSCVDEDGDGWGWNQETNSSCQVNGGGSAEHSGQSTGDSEPGLINAGGIRISWPANSASENVSEYEAVGRVNGGSETGYYRGNATEFSVRFTDIAAIYSDTICIRVRAIRLSNTGDTATQTTSDWSNQSCITIPNAPLRPPQMIELSLIE